MPIVGNEIFPTEFEINLTKKNDNFRVYLYYHTVAQVFVGSILGTIFGCIWYYFINYYFIRYVPFIVDQPLAKYLLIRDYSPIPNLTYYQYESEYAEAK